MYRIVFHIDLGGINNNIVTCKTNPVSSEFAIRCMSKDIEQLPNVTGHHIEELVVMAPNRGSDKPVESWVVYCEE